MLTNSKTASGDPQASPEDGSQKKSAKQFTYDLFAWLNEIKADADLPPSAFKVAFEIGQYINRKTGDAWPSSERIGSGIAMSQATVITMVRKLVASGYLDLEPGRPGRGHSHRYRMVLKPQQAKVSRKPKNSAKTSGSSRENLRIVQIKPQPADKNHLKNHLENHTGAASPPPPVPVDRDVPITERDRAYGALYRALLQAYPEHHGISSDSECRAIFYHLLDTGHDEDKIIDGAFDYADQCREIAPKNVKPLIYYLRVKGWQQENLHLLQPVH